MKEIFYAITLAIWGGLNCSICGDKGRNKRGIRVFQKEGIWEDDESSFDSCEKCCEENGFIEKINGCSRANYDVVMKYNNFRNVFK